MLKNMIKIFSIALIFIIQIMLPVSAQATDKPHAVSNDDVIAALESFIQDNPSYESFPFRLYTKRIMDTVTYNDVLEIRIVDRSRDRILKSDNFQAVIMSNGKTLRRMELRTYVGIEVPIAVASRDLNRGDRVEGAYDFRWCDLSGSPVRAPIYEGEEVTNRVVRVNIRAGREIDESLLELPDLVKRGDKVVAIFANGGLMLTMSGKALEDGKKGDTIKVLNESSGKTVSCEVTGEGEVRIKSS